jgi:integrase
VIDLGPRPAQRCNDCGGRFWVKRAALTACPRCGGGLRDTLERHQQVTGGFATKAAALKARTEVLHELGQGTHVVRDDVPYGVWLIEEWLPSLEHGRLRATTRASYASHVNNHLAPTKLGAVPIQQLTREQIAAHYAWLLRHGRANGIRRGDGSLKPLSDASLRRIHATVHRSLRDAVRSHLLSINPANDLDLPHGDGCERKLMAWDSVQLRRFLHAVKDDRLFGLWLTYATTGARRGELLGLRWEDVDLEGRRLTIRRAHTQVAGEIIESKPKTQSGVRTIELDPTTVAALRSLSTKQKAEHLAAGASWHGSGFVFVDEIGQSLVPDIVSRSFSAAVKTARGAIEEKSRDAHLPSISLHGLRHTHATILLIELKWPATVVSKRLGHKNEMITLTMYAEALPRYDGEAAAAFAGLVLPRA